MRRRGVAKALLEEAEAWFNEFGIKIRAALIHEDNEQSRILFAKLGFTEHRDIIYFSKREGEEV
jgi:GNAT superfamily N-acetyltransferase